MKKTIMLALMLATSASVASMASADVRVQGYVKKDGTYVQPHIRSNPDNTRSNNYSTYGNTNPYTGRAGTK